MSELHRVRHWAEALLSVHLSPEWSFGFDNAKRRAGLCDFTRKRKLLEKQQRGKARMKTVGKVPLTQKAFWSVLST